MTSWQIGAFTVTEIEEMPIAIGLLDGLIAEATPEVVRGIEWLHPHFATAEGQTRWDIHSYVVDTGSTVVLVDPGCGNGKSLPVQPSWSGLETAFLERLADAGYGRDDIDVILCTHLHLDHIGWCTMRDAEGRWVPTFPNARLVLVDAEFDHFTHSLSSAGHADAHDIVFEGSDPSISRQARLMWQETIWPVVEAERLELVPSGAEVVPGVIYEATVGHTGGHHSIRLSSGESSAFITGDFIHHPIQIARPEWSSRNDWDRAASARGRRAFLEAAAGSELLVLGTHFAGDSAGTVVADGTGYRLVPLTD